MLDLPSCDVGKAKRILFFAVNSIKYLFHALYYDIEHDGKQKLPVIVFSSYTDKYWFKGVTNRVGEVINFVGTMWHPDFCLRKFGRGQSLTAIREKNVILYNFYVQLKEVKELISSHLGTITAVIDDTVEVVPRIFERVDKPMTDAEREEEYQLRLAGCKAGGKRVVACCYWLLP